MFVAASAQAQGEGARPRSAGAEQRSEPTQAGAGHRALDLEVARQGRAGAGPLAQRIWGTEAQMVAAAVKAKSRRAFLLSGEGG